MFTLEQLAHFERCLFPDDIAKEIGEAAGYNDVEIAVLRMELRSQVRSRPLSVVSMFQDRIRDKRFCDALKQVLTEFCIETAETVKRYELKHESEIDVD